MPITKSAIKHTRSDERKRVQNQMVRSELKTIYKKIASLVSQDAAKAKEQIRQLISKLDKAAKKGVISKQKANRKKSRLALLLAKSKPA